MIPITRGYHCPCGNIYTHQETVQHGALLRLLINSSAVCPECKRQLQASVVVTYAPLQSDLMPVEKAQQLTALFTQWNQDTTEQEQRETFQALVDAGVIDEEKEQQ